MQTRIFFHYCLQIFNLFPAIAVKLSLGGRYAACKPKLKRFPLIFHLLAHRGHLDPGVIGSHGTPLMKPERALTRL